MRGEDDGIYTREGGGGAGSVDCVPRWFRTDHASLLTHHESFLRLDEVGGWVERRKRRGLAPLLDIDTTTGVGSRRLDYAMAAVGTVSYVSLCYLWLQRPIYAAFQRFDYIGENSGISTSEYHPSTCTHCTTVLHTAVNPTLSWFQRNVKPNSD